MTTFKTRGLVLREYEAGESDKRLLLLCKGYGRISVYARGARKAKSKFLAASQMLTYGDYVIADGRQFYSMAQAALIESFYPIRQDYERLQYAQCLLEICEKAIPAKAECDPILQLTLKTLQHISGEKIALPQALCVFLFRFYSLNGLAPEMDVEGTFFNDEGLTNNQKKPHITLSSNARKALQHILNSSLNESFIFQAHESTQAQLTKAARLYWQAHFPLTLQTDIL